MLTILNKIQLHKTSSGEFTLYVPQLDETYHSRHGAISESLHVFIDHGLAKKSNEDHIHIFELGFGTGLNALLSALYAQKHNQKIYYHSVETIPLDLDLINELNYGKLIDEIDAEVLYKQLHTAAWDTEVKLSDHFILHKQEASVQDVSLQEYEYDVVYFDAFGPQKQPELWEASIFAKLKKAMKPTGILTTYSAAGHLKRKLLACGFHLEHPSGANGKREMTVAYSSSQENH